MSIKLKQYPVKYVDGNDVFEGNPSAWQELESSGTYGHGADKSLASRDGLIQALNGLECEGNTKSEVTTVVERLKEIPATVYVDISNVSVN